MPARNPADEPRDRLPGTTLSRRFRRVQIRIYLHGGQHSRSTVPRTVDGRSFSPRRNAPPGRACRCRWADRTRWLDDVNARSAHRRSDDGGHRKTTSDHEITREKPPHLQIYLLPRNENISVRYLARTARHTHTHPNDSLT